MLTSSKFKIVQDLIAGSTKEELIWLNGYLAGIVAGQQEPVKESAPEPPAVGRVTIAYGTETGNSKKLATEFASRAKQQGIQTKLVSLDQYRLSDLSKEDYFLSVISTQGDGEPPAAAKKFFDHIHKNGFKLEKLKYAVLALGDTAYPLFCKAGEDVDQQLSKLGGERILNLQKCDLEYQEEADSWFAEVLKRLRKDPAPAAAVPLVQAKKTTGRKIYRGRILTTINLNDRGSNKHTRHIEIEVEGGQCSYAPGDSLGIFPKNPSQIVDGILQLTNINPDKKVSFRGEEATISHLLRNRLNIMYLPERIIQQYSRLVQQEIPPTKMGLLELLKIYPVKGPDQFEEALSFMEPAAPRLYSIASSPGAHPGEVHILVARDQFLINQELKSGLCSGMLTDMKADEAIEFYIHHNDRFRLPAPDKDIIMIGPGTGIAPFRSFLSERDAAGASGRNWLFFGDQHFTTDFLYQTELHQWDQSGVLNNIHVAFSRDQKEKIYVQHKMKKEAATLFSWIENGAHIYVCGAKEPMSVDVENTLVDIIAGQTGKSRDGSIEYLQQLSEAGRYLKDVY